MGPWIRDFWPIIVAIAAIVLIIGESRLQIQINTKDVNEVKQTIENVRTRDLSKMEVDLRTEIIGLRIEIKELSRAVQVQAVAAAGQSQFLSDISDQMKALTEALRRHAQELQPNDPRRFVQ